MDDSQKRTQGRVQRVREALATIAARTFTGREKAAELHERAYTDPSDATLGEAEAYIRKLNR